MLRPFILSSAILIFVAVSVAIAAPKPGDVRDTEIRDAIATLADAFNRGDVKSLAACWTADGEIARADGQRVVGRSAIEAAFRGLLAAHPECKLALHIVATRFLTDNVALVDLVAKMTPAIEGAEAEPIPSMVLVNADGRWLVAQMNETLNKAPAGHLHLKNLQWMVGDWSGEGTDGISVSSTCDWNARGTYLIRKFTAQQKDAPPRAGTEVIGWDPRSHDIRSWTFDADGGFGESTWVHDGNCWIIKYRGTGADGASVSATHVVTVVDATTLTVQSRDRVVDGQKRPDLRTVTIKRRSAEKAGESKPGTATQPPKHVLP